MAQGNASPQLKAALKYARRGWPVFPQRRGSKAPLTEHGFKDATTDVAQIRAWWRKWPDANVGIWCRSHLAVFDVDGKQGLSEFRKILREHGLNIRDIPMACTGRGMHYYFAGKPGLKHMKLAEDLELITGQHPITLPPSVHPSGKSYRWEREPNGHLPTLPPKLHQELDRLSRSGVRPEGSTQQGGKLTDGRRQDLASVAGSLRRRGLNESQLLPVLWAYTQVRHEPHLTPQIVQNTAKSIAKYPAEGKQRTIPFKKVLWSDE